MVPFKLILPRQFPMTMPHGFPPGGLPPGAVDESRAPQVVIGNAVVQVVGSLVFFARVFSRLMIINSWKLEDSVLVAAWVFATGYSACQYAEVEHGAGRHLGIILRSKPSDVAEAQKYAFAAQIISMFALALPKYSICLTYLRIFHADIRGRRMIQGVIFLVLFPLLPFFFLAIFQCKPLKVYWTEGRPASKCITDISGIYIGGSLNVLVDVALMAIVLPRVLELQLHARQRWALVGIVALGSFAALAGIVRMVRVGTTLSKANFDATWDAYDISIWTSTEIYVSLLCAAAPGIKPLISKILPKLLGSTLSSRSRTKTTVNPPGSIEMSLKMRRGTIGSNRVRANTHDSVLDDVEGFYEEVGRGVDSESLDDGKSKYSGESALGRGIMKTSEVSIRTSVLR
ncbi:hypothetical protein K458DRAFT_432103 [Lentithecium fluviatile CBS 122367]|uniref:Rhodopsin domain-containing protein n=1 Tax=Lentithecium fluviatile CBS 122367 TaxID=1168545 RepID=A0A6G1IYT2_9PLEO|nr:hypothetical protein K458DRAFT_432103 [Lentithecium fluviatile CBS 122367]